ncbi:MAG: hypothetical protein ACRELG_01220 [Gemmataceae bacterium]
MALRFVLDEHLRGGGLWQIIQQHNAQGLHLVDTVRVGDPADLPLGSADPDVLIWAERKGRILLSRDYHSLPGFLFQHLQRGRHSPGVFLLRSHASLSSLLTDLIVTAHAGDAADFQDIIRVIPF